MRDIKRAYNVDKFHTGLKLRGKSVVNCVELSNTPIDFLLGHKTSVFAALMCLTSVPL